MVSKNQSAQEVARWTPSRDDLENVNSLEEFASLLKKNNRALVKIEEFDSINGSFAVLDKKDLVGRPFVILGWKENIDKERDTVYAVVYCMLADNRKVLFTDGSTGVFKQLTTLFEKDGVDSGILCDRGLTVSNYTVDNHKTGKKEPAKTYYLTTN